MMKIPKLVTRKFLFDERAPITAPLYEIAVARNGVFKRAKRAEMTAVVQLERFATKIPELADGQTRVELAARIPGEIFAEIIVHARANTDKQNFTENLYAVCFDDNRYRWQEISRERSFGSTIAHDDSRAYQNAILEIHTHPVGCYDFSRQDTSDEAGKFRLFGILVDLHTAHPAIRLRVGVYDSFWEIRAETIINRLPKEFVDLVNREETTLAFFSVPIEGVEEHNRLKLTCAPFGFI